MNRVEETECSSRWNKGNLLHFLLVCSLNFGVGGEIGFGCVWKHILSVSKAGAKDAAAAIVHVAQLRVWDSLGSWISPADCQSEPEAGFILECFPQAFAERSRQGAT